MDAQKITELRNLTNAGIAECKMALEESGGDIEKAIEVLRKKGALKASKKTDRQTSEGIIEAYIHANGKVGALVALKCETDFAAKNELFKELAHDLAMQVVASQPLYISSQDIPAEIMEKEKAIYAEQLAAESKPSNIMEKILLGKMEKYYQDVCLLNQTYIKDEGMTIQDLINQKIATLGENIEIKSFVRFNI